MSETTDIARTDSYVLAVSAGSQPAGTDPHFRSGKRWRALHDAFTFTNHVKAARLVEKRAELEKFGEDAASKDRDSHLSTPAGAVRSLINAAVSGGVLALAFEVPRSGSLSTAILLAIGAFLLNETLLMLYLANVAFGTSSYTGAARHVWGKTGLRLVTVSLALGQFAILVGYANVLRDTIPWVLQNAIEGCVEEDSSCDLPWYLSSWFIITLLMLFFIVPISVRSDPDIFAKISFTTFIHFFLFMCLVIYGVIVYHPSNQIDTFPALTNDEVDAARLQQSEDLFPPPAELVEWGPELVLTLVIAAFAMEAHTSGLAILFGTRMPAGSDQATKTSIIKWITRVSFGAVLVYYLIIMLGCYMAFGGKVEDNCLNSFPGDDAFAMVVRATYAFELGTSIPIYAYSMRRDVTAALMNVEGNQSQMDAIEAAHPIRTQLFTVFLIAVATVLGLILDLSTILGFAGSVVTSANTFILPALLYRAANIPGRLRTMTPAFVVLGILLSGIGFYQQVVNVT